MPVLHCLDATAEKGLPVEGRLEHDAGHPPGEPPEVGLVPQGPIEPRRGHFERVRPVQRIVHVEDGTELTADRGAVLDADAVLGRGGRAGPIDGDAHDPPLRLAGELQVEQFQPVGRRHALGNVADADPDASIATACLRPPSKTKKWALLPTQTCLFSTYPNYRW